MAQGKFIPGEAITNTTDTRSDMNSLCLLPPSHINVNLLPVCSADEEMFFQTELLYLKMCVYWGSLARGDKVKEDREMRGNNSQHSQKNERFSERPCEYEAITFVTNYARGKENWFSLGSHHQPIASADE